MFIFASWKLFVTKKYAYRDTSVICQRSCTIFKQKCYILVRESSEKGIDRVLAIGEDIVE